MLRCGFAILLHAFAHSWLKSKLRYWWKNKENLLQLRGLVSKLNPSDWAWAEWGFPFSQDIQTDGPRSSSGNQPVCNTLSGTTRTASDLHPCRWRLIFINLINFEDEFIAADKIANYRPQQNSLGSKLVSVWAESPGRMGWGGGVAVYNSPVRQPQRQQRK